MLILGHLGCVASYPQCGSVSRQNNKVYTGQTCIADYSESEGGRDHAIALLDYLRKYVIESSDCKWWSGYQMPTIDVAEFDKKWLGDKQERENFPIKITDPSKSNSEKIKESLKREL